VSSGATGRPVTLVRAIVVSVGLFAALAPLVSRADPTDDDPNAAALDPDYAAGKKAIDDKRWNDAIRLLSSAALRDTRNADIQNYLGYAQRHAGHMAEAFKHYERALKLNPRHRGAHEYVGEAYLMVGDLMQAQAHLKTLETICTLPCEEKEDLEKRIAAYRREKEPSPQPRR
jgi:tetratricopeptide (TPR) repeat protein